MYVSHRVDGTHETTLRTLFIHFLSTKGYGRRRRRRHLRTLTGNPDATSSVAGSLAIFPARRSSGSADPRGGYVLNFENRAGASERASCRACLWSRFGPPAPAASRSLRHQVMDHLVRGAAAARGGRLSAPLRPHRATRSCSPSLSGDDVFRRWCRRQTDLKRLKTRTAGPMTAVGRSAGQRFFMAHPKP